VFAAFIALLRPSQLPHVVIVVTDILAVCLLVVYIFVRHQPSRYQRYLSDHTLGPTTKEDIDIEDLVEAESFILNNYPLDSVDYFRRILTKRSSYLSRVDERMNFDGRTGLMHTTLFFRQEGMSASMQAKRELRAKAKSQSNSEDKEPRSVLLPLVSMEKEFLFDNFEAYDQSGTVFPTLSQWEARGLLVAVLRSLFTELLSAKNESWVKKFWPKETRLKKQEGHLLLRLALAVVRASPDQDKRDGWDKEVKEALSNIEKLDPNRFDKTWKGKIDRLCMSLARQHLIVVEVPHSQTLNMVLSYRNVVTPTRVNFKFEERKRDKHGLMPVVIDTPMVWAFCPIAIILTYKHHRVNMCFIIT
jgi:hypothetical protein